jgi:hypothetical protein
MWNYFDALTFIAGMLVGCGISYFWFKVGLGITIQDHRGIKITDKNIRDALKDFKDKEKNNG